MTSTSTTADFPEPDSPGESDGAMFAALEKEYGETLKSALNIYLATSDELCDALQEAAACAHWQEAARLALKIGVAASNMGFEPVAHAARSFADAAYAHTTAHGLRNGAQMVVFEYERLRLALESAFPELVAPGAYSVA